MRQRMILAAVPRERLPWLRAADPDFVFVPADGWAEAVELIRTRPVETAVLDPMLSGGEPRTHEIERIRQLFPSLPLLLYTALGPQSAAVLLALGRSGIRRAIFHRFDDAPATLRAALQAELDQCASQQVLQSLGDLLDGLPGQFREALGAVLGPTNGTGSVGDLARFALVERRTCERWFVRAGLPSPRLVMIAVRMLYAHRLLQDPGYTVEDVALRLGYGKTKTMQMHCREVFGLPAGEVRITLSADEATAMVVRRYLTRAGAGAGGGTGTTLCRAAS